MKEKIAASKTLKKVFLKIAAIVKENILESAFHVDCYQATKMHANNLLPIFPSQTVAVLLSMKLKLFMKSHSHSLQSFV